ncbi:uncharacterized protein LOC111613252 [Centruroides sculpturatus]|uniref:uncharacterized protein LOC111613252 n=1 Tax=Centruroides sculpturatus TaxID=218467 RepID=UPI000C6D6635|nr:uncharacterized protein LOC111613252 [Centruroides sculpturatus]
MKTESVGARYFLLVKDDLSRFRTVYFLKGKNEAKDKIRKCIKYIKNNLNYKVKIIRTDNGKEEVNRLIKETKEEKGIVHQLSCKYSSQQNSRIEREMRTIVEAARTMIHAKGLSKSFWAEAVNTAVHLFVETVSSSCFFYFYVTTCENGKVLNYNSNIPQYIKENIFIMEHKKIENRTSSLQKKEKHLNELRTKFLLNSYPKRILNNWERKMNNKRLENKQNRDKNTVRYIPFPYIRGFFEQVNKSFDKINIKLASTYNNLQKRIRETESDINKQPDKYNTTEVVYKIPCTCELPKVYIGETKRKLETRLKEHIADLKYSRINSVFYEHCTTHNCKIDKNDAIIVHTEKNWYKRKFKESYEITTDKNNINKNLSIDIHKN